VNLCRLVLPGAFLYVLAAVLRLIPLNHQGLWADELFSLAVATGHSLEHAASRAQPALGDYVEAAQPLTTAEYQRYLQHETPPVGPRRVVRAVFLSDANGPLYYLLLWGWTRALGTDDVALRLFSVLWALASFPLVWSLARQLGGRPAILPAGLLYTVSPICLLYSTEGRMYSLLWFLALCLIWLTLRLNLRGPRPLSLAAWVAVGAAGLLTHYFYAFVFVACFLWLHVHPGRFRRLFLVAVTAVIGLLILPWYINLPESLYNWRVTGYWLYIPLGSRTVAALSVPWNLVLTRGHWALELGVDMLAFAAFVIVATAAAIRLSWRVVSKRRLLVWLSLAAACLGPVLFDLVMGTYTTLFARYAMAGMPALLLLFGLAFGRVQPAWRAILMALIIVAWFPAVRGILTSTSRGGEPFREVAAVLDHEVTESDVVVVHSIPSGVAGVARYLKKPIAIYSWVGQLKQRRVPEDIAALVGGRRRIVLVKIHTVREPAPEEAWLRQHAELLREVRIESAEILHFAPAAGRDAGQPASDGH
jgi:Dolichyl-phosphate-mannose-protein mannosyltransferase